MIKHGDQQAHVAGYKRSSSWTWALSRMQTSTFLYLFAVCWRVFVSVSTRTFFQPDEFYQSLEVAHFAVFGYGHLTWEWKAEPPIRSFFYPSIYASAYWLLKTFEIDSDILVVRLLNFSGCIKTYEKIDTRSKNFAWRAHCFDRHRYISYWKANFWASFRYCSSMSFNAIRKFAG